MSFINVICQQGTEDWFNARVGVITASMASECRKVLVSGPNKGGYSQKAKDYAFKLAYERIACEPLDDHEFSPWQAKRGQLLEGDARSAYEAKNGVMVIETGFALSSDRIFGASVDGLVGDDGNIEIKCFLSPSKLAPILFENDIGDCSDQVQMGMWITGRKWCDFVLYCPALKSIDRDLTVIRVKRDDEEIQKISEDLLKFNSFVQSIENQLRNK
ncbi:MAG: YqaJ viral recombinase family protein [Marinagarivorans sp.]|nr:YqaJ viral recombinase family protein [Marinagarivorans sp.]